DRKPLGPARRRQLRVQWFEQDLRRRFLLKDLALQPGEVPRADHHQYALRILIPVGLFAQPRRNERVAFADQRVVERRGFAREFAERAFQDVAPFQLLDFLLADFVAREQAAAEAGEDRHAVAEAHAAVGVV